jgi:hypothetical protein
MKALLLAGSVLCALSVNAKAADDVQKPEDTAEAVFLELTPSSAQLAGCMPDAKLDVAVQLTTAQSWL